MKTLDRLIITVLVIGVWALVLKPETPHAHSGQSCQISYATGYGTVDNKSVYVYDIDGDTGYGELANGSVTIDSITGEVYCY